MAQATTAKPKLLIDGDIFLYRASAATEFECDWGDDVWVLSANLEEARDLFAMSIAKLHESLGRDDTDDPFIIALSDPSTTFRHSLSPSYKGGRGRKPIVYNPLREWVKESYKVVERPKLEADDVLGILATGPNANYIVVSEDKDLQTIPGKLYRQGELREISEEEADYFWLYQTLTGDPTDGYSGCPGYGPVKAAKALKINPSFATVEAAYLKAGLTRDDAIMNARLARILRYENWDKQKQEVKLWEPNSSNQGT